MEQSKPVVYLAYIRLQGELPRAVFAKYLTGVPASIRQANARYVRWQDKQAHLFGKLLVHHALTKLGFADDVLSQILYSSHGRPYVVGNADFNLSHSGHYILCAAGQGIRLGVDVEEMRNIDFSHFDEVMTPAQWQQINHCQNPLQKFYELWTIKESVIKADSRGLTIPLKNIIPDNGQVDLDDSNWYIRPLQLDEQYAGCLAVNVEHYDLVLEELTIHELAAPDLKPVVTSTTAPQPALGCA
ncbi:4'-phosphopantetheinyl transferase family protein [Hymenobacter lucidus]|uniref:4'-phosphopantetheinyl transferase superfamily protein n=1 Tax=Hymenobacter lucidus TaxID=2880930 RepID=A0ABS8AXZ4_9BACT|nr:4'-phosphopantetheinyl transferase superfamily protein [Hymenobacter lucidus]MCB2410659.1 4'-phosphopantetheinyl transferase superfamily protein [Hymenobacter lucidus]